MPCVFLRELQFITVSLFICNSCISWSTRFVSLKLRVRFSIFDSVLFYQSLYFCSAKFMDSLTLNVIKASHSYALRPLIVKLRQEVLKFNDICLSWSSPRPVDKFFTFRTLRKFWNRQFFSIVTFKWIFDIPLLINLFISSIELKNIH